MSETGVVEQEAPAKERVALTPEQKQAAALRRDATLLRKYGNEQKAKELEAQADQIAPVAAKTSRVDPMTALSDEEQAYLRKSVFECSKKGFAAIASVVSYKKLAAMVAGQ